MKIKILIPIYNDWNSVKLLINNIDKAVTDIEGNFSVIIINDASTQKKPDNFLSFKNLKSVKIINMINNRGHGRCNAAGLKYIYEKEDFDYVIPMDGDGEDRPEEIKSLVNKIENTPMVSVVAKRVQRSEGPLFQLLYKIHKFVTFIFTGKNMNFGNYSILTKKDVEKIYSKASLWSSFSGTVKKNLKPLNEINSVRGLRYFGPSHMSLLKLLIHSFSIIAVFKYQVILRSTFMIILLTFLNSYLGNLTVFLQIIIIGFNLIIFNISRREKESELINSYKNLKDVKIIPH